MSSWPFHTSVAGYSAALFVPRVNATCHGAARCGCRLGFVRCNGICRNIASPMSCGTIRDGHCNLTACVSTQSCINGQCTCRWVCCYISSSMLFYVLVHQVLDMCDAHCNAGIDMFHCTEPGLMISARSSNKGTIVSTLCWNRNTWTISYTKGC